MPTYDWVCDNCNYHIEELLPLSESNKYSDLECIECKNGKMYRMFGTALKIAMREHEIKTRQSKHQARIADKIKYIEEKKRKGIS